MPTPMMLPSSKLRIRSKSAENTPLLLFPLRNPRSPKTRKRLWHRRFEVFCFIPAKGVGWDNCREGSNPSFSAKTLENTQFSGVFPFSRSLKTLSLSIALYVSITYAITYIFPDTNFTLLPSPGSRVERRFSFPCTSPGWPSPQPLRRSAFCADSHRQRACWPAVRRWSPGIFR